MMKKVIAMLLALMMLLALVACGGSNDTIGNDAPTAGDEAQQSVGTDLGTDSGNGEPAPEGEPIKIGHIADLTGVETMTGEEAVRSLDFALEYLGGEIAGRPVEIIVGDAQNSPAGAVDVARKLVEQDKVVAILGPIQIGQKAGVAEYMAEAGVPLIFYDGTPGYLLLDNPWLVGAGGSTPQMPTAMAYYIYEELGYDTLHTISMDNTGYRSFIDPFAEVYTGLGGTIVSQQWAPIPCPDWAPYFSALGEADAILAWSSGTDGVNLWNTWYSLGINEKLPIVAAMHGGFTDYYIAEALSATNPDAVEAMMGTFAPILYTYTTDTEENTKFVEAWVEEFDTVPVGSNLPGSCCQALQLLKTAIESIDGETDPDKVIEAIWASDITGPEGHLFFEGSQAATKDVHVCKLVQLDDGTYNYEVVKTYKDVPPTGLAVE